jgi:hypothetical protein
MRPVAYLIILLGIIFLTLAALDQHHGTASATGPSPGQTESAKRADHPDDFKRIMAYQWIRGSLVVFAGVFLLSWCRRAEKLDPFSPHSTEGD